MDTKIFKLMDDTFLRGCGSWHCLFWFLWYMESIYRETAAEIGTDRNGLVWKSDLFRLIAVTNVKCWYICDRGNETLLKEAAHLITT